jgi:hypothetical protein
MKPILLYILVAIFAIFIGSQITEGVLLLSYWQSLTANEFYTYYNDFGHTIGRFYTVLTIIAVLIPLFVTIYCKIKRSKGFNFALLSTLSAFLFLASFYMYFKGTNELFFQSALSETKLKNELIVWGYWHLGRVIVECLSLLFLILSFTKIDKT